MTDERLAWPSTSCNRATWCGSALAAGDISTLAFFTTQVAAGAAALSWVIAEWVIQGKPTTLGAASGAVAGLVAITAEPLTPSPLLSTIVGAVGGIIVVASIVFMDKAKIDDPVGAISVHGVVGLWGLLAVSFTNPEGSLVAQVIGAAVIFGWVFGTSFVTWLIIKVVMGIRVSEEEESEGLDIGEHGLEAYPSFQSNAER